MQKHSFFNKVGSSMANPKIAMEIISQKTGKAITYLLLLCLFLSALRCTAMFVSVYPLGGLSHLETVISENTPDFNLTDGRLNIDIDEPFIYDQDYSPAFIFDNGNDESLVDEYANPNGVIYIGSEKVIVVSERGAVDQFELKHIPFSIGRDDLFGFVYNWAWLGLVLLSVFLFIGLFITGIIFALIIALFSLILKSIYLKAELSFGKLYALSIHAITIILVVESAMALVNIFVPIGVEQLHFIISYLVPLVIMHLYLTEISKNPITIQSEEVYYHDTKIAAGNIDNMNQSDAEKQETQEGQFTESENKTDE